MIVPKGWRVLVAPDRKEEKTAGGIIITAQTREQEEMGGVYGTVVAVGPLAWKQHGDGTAWAKIGDRVMFSKYGGIMTEDPDTKEPYRLLNDEDIYCILEGETP
jgi:chaperonin GroES